MAMSKLTPRGMNHREQKQYNRGIIFQLLATEEKMTRSELAEKSGLTKMTLSNIIAEFIEKGYVTECKDSGQVVSPNNPAKLSISPDAPKIIGLMIHRTHVAASLCDLQLNVIKSKRIALDYFDAQHLIDTALHLTDEMLEYGNILGIGISSIGPVDIEQGIILNPPDFHDLRDIHIVDPFKKYNLPVYFNHHLNSDALAERYFGNGRHYHDFIFLCVDKGINIGIITGNQLYCNQTGFSSEIGRSLVSYNPLSNTTHRGGLGDYVDFTKTKGDELTLAYMIDILASVMSGICDILNPQAIIIGGEESLVNDSYLSQFEKVLNSRIVANMYRHIDVVKAFRTQDLESSSSAINVIQAVFNGKLLID